MRKPAIRHRSSPPALLALLLGAGAFSMPVSMDAADASSTAPTAGQPAAAIDAAWIHANRKFDARRRALLKDVERLDNDGPFRADWESLEKYQPPEWYKDAKFGIFIHWGVYSVPAFANEWYPRQMYEQGTDTFKHHLATYGPQSKFGYKDFIPLFKAEHYDPQAWAQLFKDAGAKYIVPVFEHHDGFAMYDCSLSDWTAAKMGPHRDLAGDLAKAVRAAGMHFGASSHRVEHDWFFEVGRTIESDVNDPRFAGLYGPAHTRLNNPRPTPMNNDWTYLSDDYGNDWLARNAEIVEKYHPDLMYFDWWIGQPALRHQLTRFAAFYYNESLKSGDTLGIVNYKDWSMQENSGVLDIERGQLEDTRKLYWQTDTSVSERSWGYIDHNTYKAPDVIVHQLIDIVSKNGNLLLNIGPRADGTIPEEVQQVLRSIGAWLAINGEAIYGTRPWKLYGEGPTKVVGGTFNDAKVQPYTSEDFRFTSKDASLYAIEMAWPAGGSAVIRSLASGAAMARVISVVLLGSDAKIEFEQRPDGLHLQLPAEPTGGIAYAFRVQTSP
jgi:alpha-L-fucosidase